MVKMTYMDLFLLHAGVIDAKTPNRFTAKMLLEELVKVRNTGIESVTFVDCQVKLGLFSEELATAMELLVEAKACVCEAIEPNAWIGVTEVVFYSDAKITILPEFYIKLREFYKGPTYKLATTIWSIEKNHKEYTSNAPIPPVRPTAQTLPVRPQLQTSTEDFNATPARQVFAV